MLLVLDGGTAVVCGHEEGATDHDKDHGDDGLAFSSISRLDYNILIYAAT